MAGGYLNVPTDSERNFQQRSVDSKGRAGPTLQRIADQYKTHKNNTGMLQSLFEAVAPMGMYSGDAEGAYIPSKAMQSAQGLAKVFQDWFKGGTPTVNVPFDVWPEILKSGKFKNQMELAGTNVPEAWDTRMRVEKELGGFPYPRTTRKTSVPDSQHLQDLWELDNILYAIKTDKSLVGGEKLKLLNKYLKEEKDVLTKPKAYHEPEYSETLAKQNPVYGHIYNPKYTPKHTATGFGDTHAEMSDLVKEQSKYVLGDSFYPFIRKAFSSQDMLGETSALERALFNPTRKDWVTENIKNDPSEVAKYMEMWIPNHLARINNIKNVYVPKKASLEEFDQSVAPRNLLPIVSKGRKKYEDNEWDDMHPSDDFFKPKEEMPWEELDDPLPIDDLWDFDVPI